MSDASWGPILRAGRSLLRQHTPIYEVREIYFPQCLYLDLSVSRISVSSPTDLFCNLRPNFDMVLRFAVNSVPAQRT